MRVMRSTWVALVAVAGIVVVAPAQASARTPAASYVFQTVHAARQLQKDYARLNAVWAHGSNAADYDAAVVFYEQVEALQYTAAPQPTNITARAFQPEEQVWSSVMLMPPEIESIETDLRYSFAESETKGDAETFFQNVATYDSNVTQVWALAKIPHPPVL